MLIIEDGTSRPDAESYATAQELGAYATRYGVTVPQDEVAREALLLRAALVMEGLSWKGGKTRRDQALAWPRRGVRVDQENMGDDFLPVRIRMGQMALAAEIHADDIDPPEKRKGAVVRERVDGAVEREYAIWGGINRQLPCAARDRVSMMYFASYEQRSRLLLSRS
jgi:hypothetical protein